MPLPLWLELIQDVLGYQNYASYPEMIGNYKICKKRGNRNLMEISYSIFLFASPIKRAFYLKGEKEAGVFAFVAF
uniref:Uncharacterized protein n=1 Tax=Candidatus Methanomethylicus mesodigestus TaxID=1867258 RepID=A0A7C3J424_9CREN